MQSTDMEMTINRALDRLGWRLKNGWKANEKDLQAYNAIADFVEEKHKSQLNDYQLFAKLYITFYGELLKYYGTTVMDTRPEKDINKILSMSLEQIINKFIDKAYDMEFLVQLPIAERFEPKKYKNPRELVYDFDFVDKMPYEETEQNLTSMINLAINKFR